MQDGYAVRIEQELRKIREAQEDSNKILEKIADALVKIAEK